jgi:hypothetical protein
MDSPIRSIIKAMSETTPPTRRRWYQFGLGMMLALIAVASFVAYYANWMRQRHAILDPERFPIGRWVHPSDAQIKAPGLLRFFGEAGESELIVAFYDPNRRGPRSGPPGLISPTPEQQKQIDQIQALFPEAALRVDVEDTIGLPETEERPTE